MRIEGMTLDDHLTAARLSERFDLMQQFDSQFTTGVKSGAVTEMSDMHQKAFDLLHSESSRAAFALERNLWCCARPTVLTNLVRACCSPAVLSKPARASSRSTGRARATPK